jgi:hypothetical protein
MSVIVNVLDAKACNTNVRFDSHSTVISGIHHLATMARIPEGRQSVLQPMQPKLQQMTDHETRRRQ